jgi:sec-independent protein translocase protein TatC
VSDPALPKASKDGDEAAPVDEGYDDPPMTIWDHLAELRKRLVICIVVLVIATGVAWEFQADLLAFFAKPFLSAWHDRGMTGDPFNFKSPAEGFLAMFKISLLGGVVVSTPIIFYQLWAFVAPGLYSREKKFVIPFVASSTGLFVGGGYFGWKLVFPLAFNYLLSFGGKIEPTFTDAPDLKVQPTIMLSEYIDVVTRMLLGFGLIFEIPLFIFFLSVAGIINYLHLIRYGRWFVLGSFVTSAIITPPDVTSQVMMAIPMVVLYIGSIALAYVFGKPPTQEQKDAHSLQKQKDKAEREADRARKKRQKEAEAREKETRKA